jgi:hypothetical protein
MPRFCELYPGICLKTEEKARKNQVLTITTHKVFVRLVFDAQERLLHAPDMTWHKHYVCRPLRYANTHLASCFISWRGWKQLRYVGLTEICSYGNVFKLEDGHVWVSQMKRTAACHPHHRCSCVSIVTGLDLCYPGRQGMVVRAERVAESRGEVQVQSRLH